MKKAFVFARTMSYVASQAGDVKLLVCMCGLPARGKTYVAQKSKFGD